MESVAKTNITTLTLAIKNSFGATFTEMCSCADNHNHRAHRENFLQRKMWMEDSMDLRLRPVKL